MNIEELIKSPSDTLKKMKNGEIVRILEEADIAFFNTDKTLFDDNIYDIVKSYLKNKNPTNKYFKKVGADIQINKEVLPFYMGSLDKIKDNVKEITKWKSKYKGDNVISEKLDGISCLLYYDGEVKLWTRGNGKEGQNITHILPYLNIDSSKFQKKIAIRGELIISKSNWDKISHLGSNARNVVAGATHSKKINSEIMSKIDFVAYDVLFPRDKLSTSLEYLKNMNTNIKIVRHVIINEDELNYEYLSSKLVEYRKSSEYDIDGIVIYNNTSQKITAGKNPKYAFAFKTIFTQEQVEVVVTDVEWNVSKHRLLKPIVKFEEIILNNVKIKQATGFNASYIINNKIGPGSHLIIIRSGDVIPHILKVLTESSSGIPKMPDIPYKWSSDKEVDIILSDEKKNKEQDIQSFIHFTNSLDMEGIKKGVITKLYDSGFDTLYKIIHITYDDLIKIEGFKDKSATNIITTIKKTLTNISCDKLLYAFNIFGRNLGDKKLKLITDKFPFIMSNKEKSLQINISELTAIEGIADVTAKQFIDNLPLFYKMYEESGINCEKESPLKHVSPSKIISPFNNKKFIFTGFRNKDWEKIIVDSGGKVVTAISKSTDYLIVKNKRDKSSKIDKANELGINILDIDEFGKMIG